MAVTIKDVAKLAGTSTAAVSAVLSGSSRNNIRVGEVTRARILAAARQLGFSPNPVARSLVTGKTHVLGVLFPYASTFIYRNPFCTQLLGGILEETVRRRYNLMFHTSLGDEWTQADPAALLDRRVDGILLVAPPMGHPVIQKSLENRFPLVSIVYASASPEDYMVNADDREGGRLATEHLIRLGHRRIAHLTGNPEIGSTQPRCQGYLDALATAGLPADPALIVEAGFDWQDGYRAAQQLLELPAARRPTAIFAGNDLCADGVLRLFRAQGIRVPDDVALVGFDDTAWFSEHTDPPLTSVHMPIYTMGVLATDMLIGLSSGRELENRQPMLPVSLTIRASCGAVPRREPPEAL